MRKESENTVTQTNFGLEKEIEVELLWAETGYTIIVWQNNLITSKISISKVEKEKRASINNNVVTR